MDKKSPYYAYGVYGSLGIQIGVAIGVGAYGGQWLDEKFHTTPWLMVVGVLIGCVAGMINIVKMLNLQTQDLAEQAVEQKNDNDTQSNNPQS